MSVFSIKKAEKTKQFEECVYIPDFRGITTLGYSIFNQIPFKPCKAQIWFMAKKSVFRYAKLTHRFEHEERLKVYVGETLIKSAS